MIIFPGIPLKRKEDEVVFHKVVIQSLHL
jgi:hypothetical protein